MAFFARRKELAALEARERAGESLWSPSFGERTLGRIYHTMDEYSGEHSTPFHLARKDILREMGVYSLSGDRNANSRADLFGYMSKGDADAVATAIEAFGLALVSDAFTRETWGNTQVREYQSDINQILREDRVAFEYASAEMIPFASRELHVEVVAPTLRLLAKPGWESIESAYQEALKQLADGNAPNAITDAGTALQEAFVKLGASGNALGPLIKSARSKSILAGHDEGFAQALRGIAEWVSADRSNSGDAHKSSSSEIEDAWLIVHVVGALLLRLSGEKRRA